MITFSTLSDQPTPQYTLLAEKQISLQNRHPNPYLNQVYSDNILLTLKYMQGSINKSSDIDWEQIRKPFKSEFILQPGQTFAFQEDGSDKYTIVKNTNSHFGSEQGFRSSDRFPGDGVCHLASLIYLAALTANLEAEAPRNHDFAAIPEIEKQYGVAIYYMSGAKESNSQTNLYVKNNTDTAVKFEFDYNGENLTTSVYKLDK